MKKLLFFFIITFILSACKKDSAKPSKDSVAVLGVLYWSDPAVDGAGLYYKIENSEELILKEDTLNMYALHVKYENLVGVPSRLTYTDTGDSSCLSGMMPGPCAHPLRVVEVNKLEKQ